MNHWDNMTAFRIVSEREDREMDQRLNDAYEAGRRKGWEEAMQETQRNGQGGMRQGGYGYHDNSGNYREGTMRDRDGDGRYNERRAGGYGGYQNHGGGYYGNGYGY